MSVQIRYEPLKIPKNPRPELIAGFDFETKGLGGKMLMGQYCVLNASGEIIDADYISGEPEVIMAELWRVMVYYKSHEWCAHNGNYDWRYLLPWLDSMGYDLEIFLATDSKIMSVECCGVKMRDSYLLFPQSLKKFTKQFAPGYVKKDLDFDKEEFDPNNETHIDYAITDVKGLCIALFNFRKSFTQIWGVTPNWTMASSAMKAWLTTLKNPVQPASRNYENFFRHCYSGGYVAPLFTGAVNGAITFDINSSYPAAMRKGIPAGSPMICKGDDYDKNEPGFWVIDVETPGDLIVPVLPYRGEEIHKNFRSLSKWPLPKKGSIYPKGNFRTVASSIEVNFARSVGYKIKPVYGLVFDELIYPFNSFVNTCESLRKQYKGTPNEIVVKGTQNSLYGKFGMMRVRRVVCKEPEEPELLEGWTPLDALGERYGFIVEQNEDMITAPYIAAWITANARISLFETIYKIGPTNVLYCDTDSITVRPETNTDLIPCSGNYGDFKLEKVWEVFRAHAPKVYAGKIDGEWMGACKGIPKPDADIFEKLFNGETIKKNYKSLNSLMKYLLDNEKAEAIEVFRTSTDYKKCKGWNIELHHQTKLIEVK